MGRDRLTRDWPAYGACLWGFTFALVHLYWLTGGTLGLPPGLSVRSNTPLLIIDVIAIPLSTLAAVLAMAFVRPLGRFVSRRLLLTGGLSITAINLSHSLPSVVELITGLARGTNRYSSVERFALYLYEPWFFVGGMLFALATWRLVRATRARGADHTGDPLSGA
jgi:hypothetical protein